jgi:N-acyl-D-amino-acid deacylase
LPPPAPAGILPADVDVDIDIRAGGLLMAPKFDTVIKGGTVIDGLQTPRFRADVGVRDGMIAAIGSLSAADAEHVIDATGLIVAPGVVDLHTHYDSQIFWDPWCTMSGWHGVTSVVIGNCGFGFAPCRPEDRDRAMLSLSRNEAVPLQTMQIGMPWDWQSFEEFLGSVDRTPKGVNVMSFVPLSPIYGYVVGLDESKKRPATEAELDEMCALLVEGMRVGGCGFSAQIAGDEGNVQLDFDGTPMVTDLMSDRDLQRFSAAMGSLGRGVAQLTSPIDRAEFVARASGRPVIWNAMLADGALNQHGGQQISHRDAIEKVRELNEEDGLRVFAQALTINFASEFTLEDYNLSDSIPAWREALVGTIPEKIVKLADPERRAVLKEIHEARGGLFSSGYVLGDIKVHWVSSDAPEATRLKDTYEGFTIGEIATREGKHPIDAMLDLAVAGDLKVGFATPLLETPPASMAEVANSSMALPGVSDGGAHTKFVTRASCSGTGSASTRSCRSSRRTGVCRRTRRWLRASRTAVTSRKASRPTSSSTTPTPWAATRPSGSGTTPPASGASCRRRAATSTSWSTGR